MATEFDLNGDGVAGVKVFGNPAGRPVLFGHGTKADAVWRQVVPSFLDDHRVVLIDHSRLAQASVGGKYEQLATGVDDLVQVARQLGLDDAVFIGHSASALIGALASVQQPYLFSSLVLVSPSFRNLGSLFDDDGEEPDLATIFGALSNESLGTMRAVAADVIASVSDEWAVAASSTPSGRRADRSASNEQYFSLPTLILQSALEMLGSDGVADYLRAHIPESEFVVMTGSHSAADSVPSEVATAIRSFLVRSAPRRSARSTR
jgi:sigma-B regulation protein RsbQ